MRRVEVQLTIDEIVRRSFNPTRHQKTVSAIAIINYLEFQPVLEWILESEFEVGGIDQLSDEKLDELHGMAQTWYWQFQRFCKEECEPQSTADVRLLIDHKRGR